MANKKLYNILLHNYPEVLTRRRSEVNLNVEQSTTKEPAMNVTVIAKKPKQIKEPKALKTTEDNNAVKGTEEAPKSAAVVKTETKPISNMTATKPPQANWLSRQFNTDHHYLRDIALYKSTIMHRGAMMNIPRYKLRASSLPDIYRNSSWSLWSDDGDEKVKFINFQLN